MRPNDDGHARGPEAGGDRGPPGRGARTGADKRSLGARLALSSVAAVIPLAVAFVAVSAVIGIRDERSRIVDAVRIVADGNTSSARFCVYNLDLPLCASIVDALAKTPGVASVAIADDFGQTLAAAEGAVPVRPPGPVSWLLAGRSTMSVDLVGTASMGALAGRSMGRMEVEIDPLRTTAGFSGLLVSAALMALLAASVVGGVFVTVERLVGRRLRRISAEVASRGRQDAVGGEGTGADPEAGDEIDLLERRLAESADAATREASRFRTLVDLSLQGVLVHRDFRILYANDAFARIWGLTTGPEAVAAGDLLQFIPPDRRERSRSEYERAMTIPDGRVGVAEEIANLRVDGGTTWVDLAERPIVWDGEPALLVIAVDATARRLARQEAERTARRLDLALRAANVAVYDTDLVTGEVWSSPELADMLGYPRERLSDPLFWETMLHPEDAAWVRHESEAFLAGDAQRLVQEYRVVDAAGRPRWILDQSQAVRDAGGRALRHVGAMADVDALKRAQTEAAEAAANLGLALRAADAGAFTMDVRTGRMAVDDAFVRSLGYDDAREFVAGDDWWLDRVAPEDRGAVEEALAGLIEGGEPARGPGPGRGAGPETHGDAQPGEAGGIEFRVRRRDGSTVWLGMRARAERRGAGGLADRIVGVLLDIDDRKAADLELARYRERLEALVEERTDQLRAAQRDLEQAERLAGLATLVAGVAHEVNTPLGVCVTAASSLSDAIASIREKAEARSMKRSDLDGFIDHVGNAVGIVSSNLERAATLVRRFKQVAVDQAAADRRRIDLGEYVEDVVGTLAPKFKRSPVSVLVERTGAASVLTDPGAVAQVVTNLVMNALTHAYDDGEAGTIRVVVRPQPGGGASLSVADDGKGMGEEVRARVFDPFFTTKRGAGGSGLGLSIVWNLVTGALGGRVDVYSAPGRGSEFVVLLPEAAPAAPPNAEGARPPGARAA